MDIYVNESICQVIRDTGLKCFDIVSSNVPIFMTYEESTESLFITGYGGTVIHLPTKEVEGVLHSMLSISKSFTYLDALEEFAERNQPNSIPSWKLNNSFVHFKDTGDIEYIPLEIILNSALTAVIKNYSKLTLPALSMDLSIPTNLAIGVIYESNGYLVYMIGTKLNFIYKGLLTDALDTPYIPEDVFNLPEAIDWTGLSIASDVTVMKSKYANIDGELCESLILKANRKSAPIQIYYPNNILSNFRQVIVTSEYASLGLIEELRLGKRPSVYSLPSIEYLAEKFIFNVTKLTKEAYPGYNSFEINKSLLISLGIEMVEGDTDVKHKHLVADLVALTDDRYSVIETKYKLHSQLRDMLPVRGSNVKAKSLSILEFDINNILVPDGYTLPSYTKDKVRSKHRTPNEVN